MTAPALVIVVAPYSRCTPMARKTTSVARSPSVMSAVAPEPTPVAIAATPSSASPRHVASSASHSGITLAAASASSVARPSRSCRTSSAVAQPQPDNAHTRGFAPITRSGMRSKTPGGYGTKPDRSAPGRRRVAESRGRRCATVSMLQVRARSFAPLTCPRRWSKIPGGPSCECGTIRVRTTRNGGLLREPFRRHANAAPACPGFCSTYRSNP